MGKFLARLGLFCWLAAPAWVATAEPPGSRVPPGSAQPLTSLRQIHSLSNDQASAGLPVAFAATVSYYDPALMGLWVQDRDEALYVETFAPGNLSPGDRVLIRGVTQESFRPIVAADSVALLGHGAPPPPVAASFADMIDGELDCRRVVVRARVRAADLGTYAQHRIIELQLLMDGGYIEALLRDSDGTVPGNLLDAEVEITGVVAARFDGKRQLTGAALYVNSLSDIRIVERATLTPRSLPVTPMDRILKGYNVLDRSRRVRVQGTITYYRPGMSVVLENGDKSLLLMTETDQPLHVGDFADATGFPDGSLGYLTLTHNEIEDSGRPAPVAPRAVTLADILSGQHAFDLVSTEGKLVMAVREGSEDEYVMMSDGHLFSAIYRHPSGEGDKQMPKLRPIEPGSRVRVTGICMFYGMDPFNQSKDVDMLLRSPDDVEAIGPAPLMNVENLTKLAGFLLVVVIAACLWGLALSRKVARQTNATARRVEAEAALEKRRSRILEDINGIRPLKEILSEITELVSFKLDGAPCWCELEGGARQANRPDTGGAEVLWQEIVSRSGPPHGKLFAAVTPRTQAHGDATEALGIGAWLATAAIETRGLYSDLRHRSEYDLLTNVYNRFSLETQLDALVELAAAGGRQFGLVYIDLDDFKQVNDRHGHQVGDLYLQQSALRMQHQLRPSDLLARIGGDEFAALLLDVDSRMEVAEIALRLERCFASRFDLGKCVLHGSASVGFAVYPQDGTTRDALLSAADTEMYVAKNAKRGAAARV